MYLILKIFNKNNMEADYIMGAFIFGFILLGIIFWFSSMDKKEWKYFIDSGTLYGMMYPIGICVVFIVAMLYAAFYSS